VAAPAACAWLAAARAAARNYSARHLDHVAMLEKVTKFGISRPSVVRKPIKKRTWGYPELADYG
jgi:hypothetical protein